MLYQSARGLSCSAARSGWIPAVLSLLSLKEGGGTLQGEVEMKSYFIEDSMKRGPVENLYDVMAQRMVEFAVECGESVSTPEGGERPVVGFCFSFPVMQTALNAGSLIEWTKGAYSSAVMDRDIARGLNNVWSQPL